MSKNQEDPPHELENQFILRLPPEYAATVRKAMQSGNANLKDKLTIELHPDGRHGIVCVDGVPLPSKLVDLPCIIESLKTVDKKTFYKTADVCQMLVSSVDGDLYPPVEGPVATNDPKVTKKKEKEKEKKFIWNHGVTLPLKNIRQRRFRKTAKKKFFESPDVEKEVRRLLSTDAEAVSTRWEIITEDELKDTDNQSSLTSLDISPGMSSYKQGRSSSEYEKFQEICHDISSDDDDDDDEDEDDDDEEEEEDDNQDNEEININTEEDLERSSQSTFDEQRRKDEKANYLVVGLQKQIDVMKGKHQETWKRAKHQEDLVFRVANLALKSRLQAALDEIKQQEEQEKQQLSSLQEQLDSLLEKKPKAVNCL
ncbi:transcription initiation factor TFIID subunit 7-like isoform X2 [Notamacropus eugenii]|uniref:transcription initiation factor TFIID subunit 7-like isoform X2 n=2 Tax=Notamacropus eugenii TaxID=9315 RepID=UPI003B677013